jgi:hypothetical protein
MSDNNKNAVPQKGTAFLRWVLASNNAPPGLDNGALAKSHAGAIWLSCSQIDTGPWPAS